MVDGTIDRIDFKAIDLSKLPKPDPFSGAIKRTVERLSLVDGGLEEVEITVLPSIGGNKK